MIYVLIIACLALVFLGYRHQKLLISYAIIQEKIKGQEDLKESFQSLSIQALEKTNDSLLEIAQKDIEQKQQDIRSMVDKMYGQMHLIEKERKSDHGAIKEHLCALIAAEKELKTEATKLSQALRSPTSRGKWGEIQLKRVVELAGMVQHCDFFEQSFSVISNEKKKPDLIIQLPGERQVIVDAKVPLESYLEGIDSSNETIRLEKFKNHARHLKDHITQLGKKNYWQHFSPTPEFVILFLPSETIFAIAMESDPTLMEYGINQNIIIATPMTLITLLRSVAYGWKQENLSRNTEKIGLLGTELCKKISDLSHHWTNLGKCLTQAVDSYNLTTSSLERNILSNARKMKELGASFETMPIKEIEPIDKTTRSLNV
jgi:DNA recombination protein RmuC